MTGSWPQGGVPLRNGRTPIPSQKAGFVGLLLILLACELGSRWLGRGIASGPLGLARGLAAGALIFSLLGLILSCLRVLQKGPILGLTGILSLSLVRSRVLPQWRQVLEGWGALSKFLLLLSVLASLAPCSHWDAHVYHYALPRLYLEAGGVYWTELGSFNGMPHTLHLLYAWSMALGGEWAANLWGPAFLWVLTVAISSVIPPEQPGTREVARILTLSSPILFVQSSGGLCDLPLAAYSALALAEAGSLWAGLWLAAMFSIRITAAPAVVALILLYGRRREILLPLSGVLILPWLLFNLVHTGNPVYPLGSRWPISQVQSHQPQFVGHALWPQDPTELSDWLDRLSPLLLLGLLLNRPLPWRLYACVGLYLLQNQALHLTQARYCLPGLIWLIPAAADGLSRGRLLWLVQLSALSVLAWLWPRLGVICGLESRQSFLQARLPQWNAYQWLSKQGYSRVLLTENRGYLCPIPYVLADSVEVGVVGDLGPRLLPLRVAQCLGEKPCDVVLWNLAAADARQALGLDPAPPGPPKFRVKTAALQAAARLTQVGREVYRQGDILVVELNPPPLPK